MRIDKMPISKLATNTIKINGVRDDLQASLNDRRAEIPTGTVEEKWNAFKSIDYKVFKEKRDTALRKHEDWFDGNSIELKELINNRKISVCGERIPYYEEKLDTAIVGTMSSVSLLKKGI